MPIIAGKVRERKKREEENGTLGEFDLALDRTDDTGRVVTTLDISNGHNDYQ